MKRKKIRFDIVTLFPEAFASFVSVSILKRAIEAGSVELLLHDIRQYVKGRHRVVDDKPYGGGAGMLIKAEPVIDAVNDVEKVGKKLVVMMTPQGEPLTQQLAAELTQFDQIVFVCGHYEGIDQRARDAVVDREISIGDYVLTGGELPAQVVCDSVARLIEGVLGNESSHIDESFSVNMLEAPHYTRPAEYNGRKVPEVLLKGNHKKIIEWKKIEAEKKTKKVRPDLLK